LTGEGEDGVACFDGGGGSGRDGKLRVVCGEGEVKMGEGEELGDVGDDEGVGGVGLRVREREVSREIVREERERKRRTGRPHSSSTSFTILSASPPTAPPPQITPSFTTKPLAFLNGYSSLS
jgi:hypothetical protein